MKQVPEENKKTKKVTAEQQLQILRDKLTGNNAFAVCRGKMGTAVIDLADECISGSTSPTGCLSRWDEYLGKARVMTNLLAQFHRDGLNIAYEELSNALGSETHLFPGETVPIEATRPVTILMLEPEKTVTFLRWLLESHWVTLREYLQWKDKETQSHAHGGTISKPNSITKKLYSEFPNLEALARTYRGGYEGRELYEAYQELVTKTFPEEALKGSRYGELTRNQWNDHVERVGDLNFVYVFEAEQSEVLKRFSREDQNRIATWQVNLPKVIACNYVGLHPVKFHHKLEKSQPAFVSLGTSANCGAIILQQSPSYSRDHFYRVAWNGEAKPGTYGITFHLPRQD